jgi:hypothetical protein
MLAKLHLPVRRSRESNSIIYTREIDRQGTYGCTSVMWEACSKVYYLFNNEARANSVYLTRPHHGHRFRTCACKIVQAILHHHQGVSSRLRPLGIYIYKVAPYL